MEEIKKPERREKPRYNLFQNSAYMIELALREKGSVLLLCACLAALGVTISLMELFIAPVILEKVEQAARLTELLGAIAFFALGLVALHALKSYIQSNTMFGRAELRLVLLEKIQHKSLTTAYPNLEDAEWKRKQKKADRATSNNHEATEAIWGTLTSLTRDIAGFICYLFLLSALHPLLAAVVIVTSAAGYLTGKRINEWGYRHRDEEAGYMKKLDYVTEKSQERTLGKDIRLFGMQDWLRDVYQRTLRAYEAFIARRERVYIWANVIDALMAFLRGGAAYAYLIALTLQNSLPASQFLLYFTAVNGFAAWVTGILDGFSTLHKQSLDICALREYLEMPEPFKFEEGEPLKPEADGKIKLELRDVSFRYPGAQADTLSHVNLRIHPGEKLAIVGLNGAGKTTLVKLLCGLYDPTQGAVLLNGADIRRYNRRDYYAHFSAVFQQFSVLETTLLENVAQAAEGIDEKKARACLEKAGLLKKALALPQKLETHIGRLVYEDGVELSGGEMQRLMLARALYKDAPAIVLDEPTAALDPIAENDIYQRYNELTAGRTSVFISHRLASTRFCDRILFMADGGIVEEGTHDALMARGGRYAELFNVQSRYYQEGGEADDEEA